MAESPAYSKFTHLDLTYQLTNYPPNTGISEDRVKEAIAKAFAKWQTASRFTFRRITPATGTPGITLTFGSTSNTVGEDRYAHTDWVGHTITFENRHTWLDYTECDWGNVTKPDLVSISAHEIGHTLGLGDNDDSGSVKLRAYDCNKMKSMHDASIPEVDIKNLEYQYMNLYYDPNATKWYKKGTGNGFKFRHVVAASDGTVFGLDLNGNLCDFRPNKENSRESVWDILGQGITRVAVSRFSKLVLAIFGPDSKPYEESISWCIWPGDLKRYDGQGGWIGVGAGKLGSGTKFMHVAVNSLPEDQWLQGARPSVWAIARLPNKVQQIVRYEGDIASGTGDWIEAPIVPWSSENDQFFDIAVGRRSSSSNEPLVWGSAPRSTYDSNALFAEWNEQRKEWGRVPQFIHIESTDGDPVHIRPGPERLRYGMVGKCVSIGDDGTVARVANNTAYRLDGATWTPLPGQVIDVSAVTRTNMWAVDRDNDICSTNPF